MNEVGWASQPLALPDLTNQVAEVVSFVEPIARLRQSRGAANQVNGRRKGDNSIQAGHGMFGRLTSHFEREIAAQRKTDDGEGRAGTPIVHGFQRRPHVF